MSIIDSVGGLDMEKKQLLIKLHDISEILKRKKEMMHHCDNLSHTSKKIIGMLQENNNLNQRSIAKSINYSPQIVCRNINKLEEFGLIKKSTGLANNENIILLTEKGKNYAADLDEVLASDAENIFKDLTDQEVEKLDEVLNKILNNHNMYYMENPEEKHMRRGEEMGLFRRKPRPEEMGPEGRCHEGHPRGPEGRGHEGHPRGPKFVDESQDFSNYDEKK